MRSSRQGRRVQLAEYCCRKLCENVSRKSLKPPLRRNEMASVSFPQPLTPLSLFPQTFPIFHSFRPSFQTCPYAMQSRTTRVNLRRTENRRRSISDFNLLLTSYSIHRNIGKSKVDYLSSFL